MFKTKDNKNDIQQQMSTTKNVAGLSLFVGAKPLPNITWESGVTEQNMNKLYINEKQIKPLVKYLLYIFRNESSSLKHFHVKSVMEYCLNQKIK